MEEVTPALIERDQAMKANLLLGQRMVEAGVIFIEEIEAWRADGTWSEAK